MYSSFLFSLNPCFVWLEVQGEDICVPDMVPEMPQSISLLPAWNENKGVCFLLGVQKGAWESLCWRQENVFQALKI